MVCSAPAEREDMVCIRRGDAVVSSTLETRGEVVCLAHEVRGAMMCSAIEERGDEMVRPQAGKRWYVRPLK